MQVASGQGDRLESGSWVGDLCERKTEKAASGITLLPGMSKSLSAMCSSLAMEIGRQCRALTINIYSKISSCSFFNFFLDFEILFYACECFACIYRYICMYIYMHHVCA